MQIFGLTGCYGQHQIVIEKVKHLTAFYPWCPLDSIPKFVGEKGKCTVFVMQFDETAEESTANYRPYQTAGIVEFNCFLVPYYDE